MHDDFKTGSGQFRGRYVCDQYACCACSGTVAEYEDSCNGDYRVLHGPHGLHGCVLNRVSSRAKSKQNRWSQALSSADMYVV